MKQVDGGITAVQGIRAAGIHAGIKAADAKDMTLIVTDSPAVAAGVFTKNSVTPPRRSSYAASISARHRHKPSLSIVGTPTPAPAKSVWRMHDGWHPQQPSSSI